MAEIKLFGEWSTEGVEVKDPGLKKYINLEPLSVPKSGGKYANQPHHKSRISIVERLITKMMVPGHRGKKHVLTSGGACGRYLGNYRIVRDCFKTMEERTKKNPVEVFVRAIENAALREEIAAYQVGGIIVRRAVIASPQRRVDTTLKNIVQAAYRKSFGKKENMAGALAGELIAAAANDASKSEAVKERERIERESEGAR
jgi:small subunit ribosomal protein S7